MTGAGTVTWRYGGRSKDRDGGFSLIELLIIIAILGILASVVVYAVFGMTSSSARAACQSNFKTVETAAEAYEAQVGHYPNSLSDLLSSTMGQNLLMVGPWLKDIPPVYTPGASPSVSTGRPYGFAIDSSTNSIAVGTIKANGAQADTGTPLSDGAANCASA
jgi:prepilin-type N-terminal cleavage/methylation domain-containing protein